MTQKSMKVGEAVFNAAYAALNAAQKQAVDTIEGPVMVIAGPGTGKTQILTLRIANILLKTDARPEHILALTFTESGARAMRERLASLIGEDAYDVGIYTFHGFADTLIKRYPDAYPLIIGGRSVSDIERVQTIEAILTDTSFKALRPSGDPAYYVQSILQAIQTLKQEYITPDILAEKVLLQEQALNTIERYHEKGAHKGKERGEYKEAVKHFDRNRELLAVYRKYEASLRSAKLYDFSDMIVKTVEALTLDEGMLRDLQEQYQYVLADEHQDVNGSQNKILELLVNFHDRPNLFVVGDEKQAIYRFQGASLDNFLYFENSFGSTTTISLTENYRSGQKILDVTFDLIKTDDESLQKLRVPLIAKAVDVSVVEHIECVHEAVEDSFVVGRVEEALSSGITPDEIAIIVRTNREVEHFATLLRKKGVSVTPSADTDILDSPVMEAIVTLLRVIVSPADETGLVQLFHQPYTQLHPGDVALILRARSRTLPLAALVRDEVLLRDIGVTHIDEVLALGRFIDAVRSRSITEAPHRLLEVLFTESGFISHILKTDAVEGVRIVRRFYDEVEGMVRRREVKTLEDVLRRIELHREYGIALQAPYISSGQTGVRIMTAHKSKGLEFELVFIPRLTDRVWGNKRSRETFRLPIVRHDTGEFDVAEDDERRLLYVAATRAKTKVIFSNATQSGEGKEQVRSRFLSSIDTSLVTPLDASTYNRSFSPIADLVPYTPAPVSTALIIETLKERGLSPTALNNYLKSPWEYFCRNVLQVPQIKTQELQFGSAVHAVLDTLVREKITRGQLFDINDISELLKQGLSKEAITDEEYVRLHERGLAALAVYTEQLRSDVQPESRTEVKFEAHLPSSIAGFETIKLTGTLDRVDYQDGKVLRVLDYKTGKPKTRGYIEGTTSDSTGDYKRQLTFYALLLSLQSDTALHCRAGVLSFVEPQSNGEIKEEYFTITDEEITALKEEIIRAVGQLVSGEALTMPCDSEQCHYCHLVPFWVS